MINGIYEFLWDINGQLLFGDKGQCRILHKMNWPDEKGYLYSNLLLATSIYNKT